MKNVYFVDNQIQLTKLKEQIELEDFQYIEFDSKIHTELVSKILSNPDEFLDVKLAFSAYKFDLKLHSLSTELLKQNFGLDIKVIWYDMAEFPFFTPEQSSNLVTIFDPFEDENRIKELLDYLRDKKYMIFYDTLLDILENNITGTQQLKDLQSKLIYRLLVLYKANEMVYKKLLCVNLVDRAKKLPYIHSYFANLVLALEEV